MSVYLNPIANGILVAALVIYFTFIPLLIHQYRTYGTIRIRANIVIISFILYIITAWFMTILPLPSIEEVSNMKPIQPNLRPFLFINTIIDNSGFSFKKPGTWLSSLRSPSLYTVVFNMVLTIPFGVYLRKYFKLSLPLVSVMGLFLSLFYELTQYTGLYGFYPHAYRFADVDDLIVNTLGTVIGYFFAGFIDKLLPNPESDRKINAEKVSLLRRCLSVLIDAVIINILFELGRIAFYSHRDNGSVALGLFLTSEVIALLLLPLLTKYKQTLGMFLLKLYLRDEHGKRAKISAIFLRNLFIGILIYSYYGGSRLIPSLGPEIIFFQLFIILGLIVMIIKSISKKQLSFYWERWFNAYLMAFTPRIYVQDEQLKE